jgi:hypothetical protein
MRSWCIALVLLLEPSIAVAQGECGPASPPKADIALLLFALGGSIRDFRPNQWITNKTPQPNANRRP